jgi:hypothetical protein
LRRAVAGAQRHPVGLDILAHRFQVRDRILRVLSGEQHGELLAAVAKGFAATAHAGNVRRHHLQDLVAEVVPVGIVEFLEVVHVEHRDGVAVAERRQLLVQRAPAGDAGQLVAERHAKRVLQHRDRHHQLRGGDEARKRDVCVGDMRGYGKRGDRARETRIQVGTPDQRGDGCDGKAQRDGEDRGLRQAPGAERDRVEELLVREVDEIGAARNKHPGRERDLRQEHAEPKRAMAVEHAALGQQRQQRQIERYEDRERGVDRARMKPIDSLSQPPLPRRVRGGQNEQSENGAATTIPDRERDAEDEHDVGAVYAEPGERARQCGSVDDERKARREDRGRDHGQCKHPQQCAHDPRKR